MQNALFDPNDLIYTLIDLTKILGSVSLPYSVMVQRTNPWGHSLPGKSERQTDRQTDTQTDRQTETHTRTY